MKNPSVEVENVAADRSGGVVGELEASVVGAARSGGGGGGGGGGEGYGSDDEGGVVERGEDVGGGIRV